MSSIHEEDKKMKNGFLIDMDGVIFKGSVPITGAVEFINRLKHYDTPFMFLTNNSQRTQRDMAMKIRRMGIDIDESHIYTCAMATAQFLAKQKPNGTAYVIGEGVFITLFMNTVMRLSIMSRIMSWSARVARLPLR